MLDSRLYNRKPPSFIPDPEAHTPILIGSSATEGGKPGDALFVRPVRGPGVLLLLEVFALAGGMGFLHTPVGGWPINLVMVHGSSKPDRPTIAMYLDNSRCRLG